MIYFDSGATTLEKPASVRCAMARAVNTMSSPGRGSHQATRLAEETDYTCRAAAAKLFGVADESNVIFTSNATHGLNIAIHTLVQPGSHVVISGYEHNAVTRPLHAIPNVTLTVLNTPPFQPERMTEELKEALAQGVDAVICNHVSNVFGCVQPVEEMAALCADKRVLYITSSPEKAQKAAADIESYTGQRCVYIGAQEQQLGASSQSHEQTHAVISALREVQNGAWAAADAAALTGFFMPPEEFASAVLIITKGQELPPERLAASLVRMGYVRAETAEAQGQFAQHGGITDIFPVGSDSPLRVEFFDTEIESLRVIDPATQRSVSRLESAQLLPARLFCPTQRQAAEAGEAMKASVRAAVRRLAGTPEASARAEGFSEAAQSIARGDVSAFEDRFSCFLQQKAGLLEYFGKDTLLVLDSQEG